MNVLDWLAEKQAVKSCEYLAGLTACSRLVKLENGERYVLREQSQRASDFGVDYAVETHILQLIEPLSLSPKVVYQTKNGSLLTWIEGDIPKDFSANLLTALAQKIAQLHTFPFKEKYALSGFPSAKATLNLSKRCQFLLSKLPLEIQFAFQKEMSDLPPVTPFCQSICHHDIHLGNLVYDHHQLWLIDWEYAAISDPALDIALFFQGNSLNEQQQAAFLKGYFTHTQFDELKFKVKIAEYQPWIMLLNRLWYQLA